MSSTSKSIMFTDSTWEVPCVGVDPKEGAREHQLSFLLPELFLQSQESHKNQGLPYPTGRPLHHRLQPSISENMAVTSHELKVFMMHD